MFFDWSTERLVAFSTFLLVTFVPKNSDTSLISIHVPAITKNLIEGFINLILALLLFIITHYLKKWLEKKSKKTSKQ